jgi:hypothetical protein
MDPLKKLIFDPKQPKVHRPTATSFITYLYSICNDDGDGTVMEQASSLTFLILYKQRVESFRLVRHILSLSLSLSSIHGVMIGLMMW